MDTSRSILIRVVTLLAGLWAHDRLWNWYFYTRTGDEAVGADIGEGLVAFALTALVAAVWAAFDAGHRSFGLVAGTWVATGVAVAAAFAVRAGYADGGAVWTDLAALSPFLVGLVAFPALFGAGLVAVVRSSRAPAR